MRNAWKWLVAVVVLPASMAMAQGGNRIVAAGATYVKPVVEEASQAFKKSNPGVEFVVGGGGTGQGIQLVSKGEINLGMSVRALTEEEKSKGLREYRIALDGVAVVVNSANSVAKLTKQQVQDLYLGKISNWKDVGGANQPVVLYSVEKRHATQDAFVNYFELETKVTGEGAAMMAAHRTRGGAEFSTVTARVADDPQKHVAGVLSAPNTIGYSSLAAAMQMISRGAPLRLVELDGVAPTLANVKSGGYLLVQPFEVITKGEAEGTLKKFIDFLTGPETQAIVTKMNYVPAAP